MALIVILGSLLVIALWEFSWPRRRREFPALRRRLGNVGFWIVNLCIGVFFSPPDSEVRMTLDAAWGISIPYWPIADAGLSFVAGFLLLDLMYYAVHRCEHAVPLFWRFHALHHSDPDVDVTTSVRHHPVEYLLTSAVYWLAALFLDVPVDVVLGHALAVFGTAGVQHGNIRLPERLEQWLQPVLVTVDMHRIHHSIEFSRENWNYGAVLSIWDRLFGTITRMTREEHEKIVFGVRELPPRDCLKPSAMLLTPWRIARIARTAAAQEGA
jgi:sterol desaturase/sphingolipid hydroxylase (fatty acid hydroxylase superfamily)